MIVVNDENSELLVVRQRDHALASAAFAERWCRPEVIPPSMWHRFVEAVRRHDDGWIGQESAPLISSEGRPLDFKAIPTPEHVAIWRTGVECHRHMDPYVALLIAQHARWLYTHVGQETVEDQRRVQAFTDELGQWIDGCIEQLAGGQSDEQAAVDPHALAAARSLLTFFDQASLILIGALPATDRTEPLWFGTRHEALVMDSCHGALMVTPWPFAGKAWGLTTVARRLTGHLFSSPQHLHEEVARAPQATLEWQVRPG